MGAPPPLTENLGPHAAAVEDALDRLEESHAVERVLARDHTLWRPEPDEIANRLGWLDAPVGASRRLEPVRALATEARAEALSRALLLGMGGSSLAPEVFRRVFGPDHDGLDFEVLDSTDPAAVARARAGYDPSRTIVLVSSKSGTTVETLSLFRRLWRDAVGVVGEEAVGKRFVAITDPGSPLAGTADDLGFRAVFLADPDVGGRYSALTEFGLVPAALVGVDLDRLLARARRMAEACTATDSRGNPGARLGAVLGGLANAGRDKLTLALPSRIASFGAWVEQLIAESTGKDGKGILPVIETPRPDADRYGDDRLFVGFRLPGDPGHDEALEALATVGHPVLRLDLADPYEVGGEMYRWEFATAVAGHLLGIHPFDQPDVESAKRRAREALDEFQERGRLPDTEPALRAGGVAVHGDVDAGDLPGALAAFLEGLAPPGYAAILAYLPPEPRTTAALERLRAHISGRLGVATTAAYGPRYLHSTGQLHKGDAGSGRFLLITAESSEDVPIPDQPGADAASIGFAVLERAQVLGDVRALREAGRQVLRLHFEKGPAPAGIDRLAGWLNL